MILNINITDGDETMITDGNDKSSDNCKEIIKQIQKDDFCSEQYF